MRRTRFPSELQRAIDERQRKPGRKRIFTQQELDDVRDLVGSLGARNKDLATYFEVNNTTIDYWIKHYPEFDRAVKKGRIEIGLRTARALVAKARGYSHPAVKILTNQVREYDKQGNVIREHTEPMYVPYTKHYPPDVNAAFKYLTIIHRDKWMDNSLHIQHEHNHSGRVDFRQLESIDLSNLSENVQEMLFELGMKQIGDGTNDN